MIDGGRGPGLCPGVLFLPTRPWLQATGEWQTEGSSLDLERKIFTLVNSHRRDAGLAALVWSDTIAKEARAHSKDMAEGTLALGHDGFPDRFARITQIIASWAGAENVVAGRDAETSFRLWLESPGHKANIVGDYDHTGVGVVWSRKFATCYATQIFIRSRQ